jgi:hypothetical protein
MAARRRHLAELLERTEGNAAWLGQVAELTRELPADDGAELLVQLADGYRASGRLDLAADTYYQLARRYPDHAFVDRCLVWLVQFYASSEAGHRMSTGIGVNVRGSQFASTEEGAIQQASLLENEPRPRFAAPAVGLSQDDRSRRAVQLAEYLRNIRPALYAEPAVRFAEVTAQRKLGFTNPAQRYHLALRKLPESDPWRQCGDTEAWLAKPGELPPPKRIATCRPAHQPPRLDGTLDETFWNNADPLRLGGKNEPAQSNASVYVQGEPEHNAGANDSAVVRIAYDAEFLYFAVQCPKADGGDYQHDERPRARDADLAQHDRVTLRLDVDRDYSTAFELAVDARGWTHDACWGDVHWNPSWYVAAASDETSWTIEAAVPIDELVVAPPSARDAWAISVRRAIPRVGYESWANAGEFGETPEQFNLGFCSSNSAQQSALGSAKPPPRG